MLGGALRDLLASCLTGCLLLVVGLVAFAVLGLAFVIIQA